jgi:hypothetical protein
MEWWSNIRSPRPEWSEAQVIRAHCNHPALGL